MPFKKPENRLPVTNEIQSLAVSVVDHCTEAYGVFRSDIAKILGMHPNQLGTLYNGASKTTTPPHWESIKSLSKRIEEGESIFEEGVDKKEAPEPYKDESPATAEELEAFESYKSKTIKDCRQRIGQCMQFSCRYNLFLDLVKTGKKKDGKDEFTIKYNFDEEPHEIRIPLCLLKHIQFNPEDGSGKTLTLDEIGEIIGVSREQVRKDQEAALKKLRGRRGKTLRSFHVI